MVQSKFALPSFSFRHRITHRLNTLSVPRKEHGVAEGMPARTECGVIINAIDGKLPYINDEIALPYARHLLMLRNKYQHVFDKKRLKKIQKTLEKSNGTKYTKLANAYIDLRKMEPSPTKAAWTDNDWKKHMDYISKIAIPKPTIPEPVVVKKTIPLSQILPRLIILAEPPEIKMYRRMSKEPWYKEPGKVSKSALTYQISPRVQELSKPKAAPAPAD